MSSSVKKLNPVKVGPFSKITKTLLKSDVVGTPIAIHHKNQVSTAANITYISHPFF